MPALRILTPAAALAAAVALAPVPASAQSTLDAVAWLAGCWESRAGERITLEMWSPPAGGLMVGASRTAGGGRSAAWEHLRIREAGDALVYTAIPSGQVETEFRSTALDGDGFTVENPAHDFPQRIRYRRTGPDVFRARVEAEGEAGPEGFEMEFRRVPCVAPERTALIGVAKRP